MWSVITELGKIHGPSYEMPQRKHFVKYDQCGHAHQSTSSDLSLAAAPLCVSRSYVLSKVSCDKGVFFDTQCLHIVHAHQLSEPELGDGDVDVDDALVGSPLGRQVDHGQFEHQIQRTNDGPHLPDHP